MLCWLIFIYKTNLIARDQVLNAPASPCIVEKTTTNVYSYPDVIYGHIHMGKTGGTFLNGFLASKYERICGHKGYTYDAYQANERFKERDTTMIDKSDLRERVPISTSHEIGFENCDFISHEVGYNFWNIFESFHGIPMQLLLPCRDPIDHLMSRCNFRNKTLDCNAPKEEIMKIVSRCIYGVHVRFSMELANKTNIDLKCYDYQKQFTTLLDYMSTKLQPRRLVSEYKTRETNMPRKKEDECIWKDSILREQIKSYLVETKDYYKFCHQCIGSKDDLLFSA